MQAQQTIVHSELGDSQVSSEQRRAVLPGSSVAANGKNMPEKKFSAGAISATVWKNAGTSKQGQPVEYRTITLQRSYKKDGSWQTANSLRLNDLPKAALLLNKAFEWLVLKGGQGAAAANAEGAAEEEAF